MAAGESPGNLADTFLDGGQEPKHPASLSGVGTAGFDSCRVRAFSVFGLGLDVNLSGNPFNLETAVGRVRWCFWAGGWHGATTLHAVASKEEQQSQTPAQTCQRVRSGVTPRVRHAEGGNVHIHAGYRGLRSGQLPFLGSMLLLPLHQMGCPGKCPKHRVVPR
jgi:hypothetical protein